MNRINLLYDATILTWGYLGGPCRAGIFFTAYNILEQFSTDSRFKITLYLSEMSEYNHYMTFLKNDVFFSQFQIITNNKQQTIYEKNISVHKNNIMLTKNILKKILFLLKIIKNIFFQITYYKVKKNNNDILKTIDAYFSPMNAIPQEINVISTIKQFLFLHDVIPTIYPQYYTDLSSEHWYIKMINSLTKKGYYFCNSESTKNDFIRYFGSQLDERKLFVYYIASSQKLFPEYDLIKIINILEKYHVTHEKHKKYIFSFSTLEPRKNLLFTISCFIKFIEKHNINDLYFYFGGGCWDSFIAQLKEKIFNFAAYSSKLVQLGYVDDKDVNILYSNSLFFTYIPEYEGFGMPPLEAMMAGTPVITSNNSSLPEVVGDAAITITYNDEEACIKAFEDLYFDKELRSEYIKKGLERAKLFSWEETGRKIKDKIQLIIEKDIES
jgi:glycosyltransferase involved in cell wall biosynthesis